MQQYGSKLLCVSDLLLLGRATIEEARSLLYWLDSEAGFGKMGICGLSMGKTQTESFANVLTGSDLALRFYLLLIRFVVLNLDLI
jgi:hypothetical protein